MKKIIILIVATVLCLCTLFAGCGDSTGYKNSLTSFAGNVSSNGGFAVVKGEYVYYINGVEVNTADNTYGKVVKGALVRTKLADLGTNNATAERVIPALFVTGSYNAGFYIYGENIYYASPRSEKNKEGTVENSKLDFFKTSYDGKKSVNLVTVDDNTTNYRFVEAGNVVYLVLETVNEDGEKILKVVNTADTKAEPFETKKLESVIFGDEQGAEVYFTRVKHNETLEKDEAYNEIYRLVLGAEVKEELVLSGNGLYPTDDEQVTSGFGIQGAKFTLVKDLANVLFVKADYVETDVTTVTHYYKLAKQEITANDSATNKQKLVLVNNGTTTASTIFASTSLFNEDGTIIYLDASLGLVKYDFANGKKENDYRIRLFYDADLVGYTVKFWDNGYLYLTDASNYYHKVNYAALLDNDDTTVATVEQITCLASSTSWYQPEIIGDYFLTVYTAEPYNSMVFVRENKGFTKDEESEKYEEIEAIQKSDIETIENNLKLRLGIATDELTESIHTYYKNTFGAKAYKEYFGEEKYNKYFG